MAKLNLLKLSSAFCLILGLLPGCNVEDSLKEGLPENPTLQFVALLDKDKVVKTRELDTTYITSSPYSGKFYIELSTEGEPNQNNGTSILSEYKVPSGFEGTLLPVDDANMLKWQELDENHTFYTWTLPWFDLPESSDPESDSPTTSYTDWTDAVGPSNEPCTIYFKDSPEGNEGYDKYKNNSIYETFIGTKAGPYNYIDHGKYVELTYRHLVSRINVEMLALVKEDNSVNKDVVGNITFMGLPGYATFYPHPENGDAPYVKPGDIDPDNGVTFFINNKENDEGYRNTFYICPEIDFSQIGFKINLNNKEYGSKGDYYGSFNDVEFIREGDEDFNNGDGTDTKILHAGEMMTLSFQLIPGVGPGISIVIQDWNTQNQHNATHHPYKGIYSNQEMEELIALFKRFNPPKEYYDPNDPTNLREPLQEIFDLYGYTDTNGNLVFPLYDNVSVDNSVIAIFKSFIIDGQGHQLTAKTNKNNTFGGINYYNIGPVRDIYLSDPDGNNKIYIDADGYVYLYDTETGEYQPSYKDGIQNQVTPLADGYYSYDINPQTGEVIQSTFYT